jgi:myo-inositol 2-dehydrogenase/D-chiro-inositol 1-dehydrogenase/scyllo-inositol 2-dehydrogenase (NAD+)
MSTSTLGICVVGCGRAGAIHARNFARRQIAGAALVALVDPSDDARRQLSHELQVERNFSDYRAALADPAVDAVVIATPTQQHCPIAVEAAQAGKHVLCEKPMAMDAVECDQMIDAAESAGIKLQIGFMRRFDINYLDAKTRIDTGEIGQVVAIQSHTYGPTIPKPWMYDLSQSNGPLAEVCSHDIDALRWLAGDEIAEVYAIAGNYRCDEARATHPDFYDNVTMVVRFLNGIQGAICGAQGVRYAYDARCEILGQTGLITVGGLAGRQLALHTARGMSAPLVGSWTELFLEAYRSEDEEFVRCIQQGEEPRATGRDGKAAVQVVTAGNRSIRERRPIRLEEV